MQNVTERTAEIHPPQGKGKGTSVPTKPPNRPIVNLSGGLIWENFNITLDFAGERHPLNSIAENLLEKFYRRRSFLTAVNQDVPVEWAGELYLGVKIRQATTVLGELREAGSAWRWFATIAEADIIAGRIHQGQHTRYSDLADVFFSRLGEGFDWDIASVLDNFCGGIHKMVISANTRAKLPFLFQQAVDYRVCKAIDTSYIEKPKPSRRK